MAAVAFGIPFWYLVTSDKKKILNRLARARKQVRSKPMLTAHNIRYEMADKCRAIRHGGIGLIHRLVCGIGLIDSINESVEL